MDYSKDDYVGLVVKSLKSSSSLPFVISTSGCPKTRSKKNRCNRHHGEYYISQYDKKKDVFLIRSYPIHANKYDEAWFSSAQLVKIFEYCLNKRKFTLRDLLRVANLSNYWRNNFIGIRVSKTELRTISNNAKQLNLSVSEYVRQKSLEKH